MVEPIGEADGRRRARSRRPGSGSRPASLSGRSMFSRASRTGSRLKNWKTKPTLSRRSSVSSASSSVPRSTPSIDRPCPRSGGRARRGSASASTCPSPTGPMIAVKAPCRELDVDAVERRTSASPSPKTRRQVGRADDRGGCGCGCGCGGGGWLGHWVSLSVWGAPSCAAVRAPSIGDLPDEPATCRRPRAGLAKGQSGGDSRRAARRRSPLHGKGWSSALPRASRRPTRVEVDDVVLI